MRQRSFTDEQLTFLLENIKGITTKEMAQKLNERFGLNITPAKVKRFYSNHGLTNGVDCRFKKGIVPHNKGKKGKTIGRMAETQFKKGQASHNKVPVGSERVTVEGYIEVKVSDTGARKWRHKQQLVWEAHHGKIPDGHVVIVADGNKQNVDIKNLRLITRQELVRLNYNKGIYSDPQLTDTSINIIRLNLKLLERQKEMEEK